MQNVKKKKEKTEEKNKKTEYQKITRPNRFEERTKKKRENSDNSRKIRYLNSTVNFKLFHILFI